MMIVVGILLAIIVTALLAIRAGSSKKGRRSGAAARRPGGTIQAAALDKPSRKIGKMLRTRSDCCEAATRTMQIWFREIDAPSLPLAACDRTKQCRCAWERVYDRRVAHRRSSEERRKTVRFDEKPDRRSGSDRRKDSSDNWRGN